MSKRSLLVVMAVLAMIIGTSSTFAANSLDVNNGAAIIGNFGLEVLLDGSANSVYVQDGSPEDESVYRLSFRIAHNNLTMNEGTGHAIFMGRMQGGEGNILRLFMRRQGGSYKFRCRWKKDAGGTGFCGQFNFAPVNTWATVEWVASSGPGANDGVIRLTKGSTLQFEKTNADNDTFEIDTARLGLPQGAQATTSGSFYLDDFQSFRTLAP